MTTPASIALFSVPVPGGEYRIGDADLNEAEAPNPPHLVTLSPFRLGKYPVTNNDYAAFVSATGHKAPSSWANPRFAEPEQPVVSVSWDDAVSFAEWGGGFLPSEAQWEAAARGNDGRRFPWGNAPPQEDRAHFGADWNRGGTSAVGTRDAGASPFGCYDMAGNVWEWCADSWHKEAHARRLDVDPVLHGASNVRPLRGGCWRSIEPKLQCAYRNWFHRVAAHTTIGFRVAWSAHP